MAETFEIPIFPDEESSFKIRTTLEDNELVLRFDWNTRQERWMMSIFDPNEVLLIANIPLHINSELIERFEVIGLPPGRLMLFDTTGKTVECAFEDLGERCKLLYQTID